MNDATRLLEAALDRITAWRDSHQVWWRQHGDTHDQNAVANYDALARLLEEALVLLKQEAAP